MTAPFRRPVGAIGHDDTVVALVRARGGQTRDCLQALGWGWDRVRDLAAIDRRLAHRGLVDECCRPLVGEVGSPNAGSLSASIGSDNRSGPGECVNTPRSVADTALGGAHVQDRSAFAAGDQVSPPEDRAS